MKLSIHHYTLIEKQMLNKPLNPPFFIHAVISWCGIITQNLNRRTKPFSFLFCAVGNKF